jgi:hypothetical protein
MVRVLPVRDGDEQRGLNQCRIYSAGVTFYYQGPYQKTKWQDFRLDFMPFSEGTKFEKSCPEPHGLKMMFNSKQKGGFNENVSER